MTDLLRKTGPAMSLLVTLFHAVYITTLTGAPLQTNEKYDFSEVCPGIRLKHGNTVLNKRDATFTEADLASLEPYLHNQPLSERMDVWCKTAEMESRLAESTGRSKWSETDISNVDVVEGDIILTRDTVDGALGLTRSGQKRLKRQMKAELQWEKAVLPYRFEESFTKAEQAVVREQLDKYEELTCLRFVENPSADMETSHLRFNKNGDKCSSTIGRSRTAQYVNIGGRCFVRGVIQHEVGHAIGLSHQHNRPDRDSYVTVHKEAVKPGEIGNFNKVTWENSRTYGVPYDYTSVMHYSGRLFRSGTSLTMIPKDISMQGAMGTQSALTLYDTKIINLQYCNDKCDSGIEWDNCKRGGYRNPNKCDECICPEGFAPPFCEEIAAHGGGNSSMCDKFPQSLSATAASKWIASPRYDWPGYPAHVTCTYMIQAPPSKVVSATFIGDFYVESDPPCGRYVELRYKNMALPGSKYCGKFDAKPQGSFVSHGPEMLVRFHTGHVGHNNQWHGFKLQYSAVNCGGCSSDAADEEPPCNHPTELYSCNVDDPERKNTCYDLEPKPYCCPKYTLSDGSCKRTGGAAAE